mmetsp:Transcript_19953/g.58271  ORF Transcript_19953/g.58271 Transcript_19953/m.58271 type:complete len:243 (-) Transcript_19953:94-822(-)
MPVGEPPRHSATPKKPGALLGANVLNAFVLSIHVADLCLADTDAHGRHVMVWANVLGQLRHEALTEALDLRLALVRWVKVCTARGASKVHPSDSVHAEGVKANSFDKVRVHVGSKVEGSLVGPQGARVLDADATIHAEYAHIIQPRDAELNEALWFNELLGNPRVLRVPVKDRSQRRERRREGLQEQSLALVPAGGLADEQLRGLGAGLELDIPLAPHEGPVSPRHGSGLGIPVHASKLREP